MNFFIHFLLGKRNIWKIAKMRPVLPEEFLVFALSFGDSSRLFVRIYRGSSGFNRVWIKQSSQSTTGMTLYLSLLNNANQTNLRLLSFIFYLYQHAQLRYINVNKGTMCLRKPWQAEDSIKSGKIKRNLSQIPRRTWWRRSLLRRRSGWQSRR